MPGNLDKGFGKSPKEMAKIFGVTEAQYKKIMKQVQKDIIKSTSTSKPKKTDGMLSSKEAGKVYNKAKNKQGKYDPTKIPGFSYGKGTR